MLRILIFFLIAVLIAGIGTWLFSMQTLVSGEAFGQRFDVGAGIAILILIIAAFALVLGTSFVKDMIVLPGKMRAKRAAAKQERGMAALTRGLEAVAVGAAPDAQHHARVAQRNLADSSLTRLLTAQAAQLAGDDVIAEQSFTAMLEAPETEFLGLRGLYAKAIRQDQKEEARGFAERAFRLRPNADWAFNSVFDLALERGAWGQARADLEIAVKNKIVDTIAAKRADAALLTANAYAAAASGDTKVALKECEQALGLASGFAPTAILAAELYEAANQRSKAAKVLETAFSETPHIAEVMAIVNLYQDEKPEKRGMQLKRLADKNVSMREAKIAMAQRALLLGESEEAITILEPLVTVQATAFDCKLMAEAVADALGEESAKPWLERAAIAPRDPTPGANGKFTFTKDGWARLIREYMHHGRLVPPPLEDAPIGLPAEEVKLLLAPSPSVPVPEEESEGTAESEDADPIIVENSEDPQSQEVNTGEAAANEVAGNEGDTSSSLEEQAEKGALKVDAARQIS